MLIQSEKIIELDFFSEMLEKKEKDPYVNSPFLPLKQESSRKKGAAFEKLVDQYLSRKGHKVLRATNSDYDRMIDGKRVEIKGSFLWADKNGKGTHFRWQQIRPRQDYDIVCFLAIYPDRVELYGATREECKKRLEIQNDKGEWIHNQHGGKKVNSGTFYMDGFPQDFPWLTKLEDLL